MRDLVVDFDFPGRTLLPECGDSIYPKVFWIMSLGLLYL